ncbi:MAG: hypothetical protein EP332_06960 [Bacteroidetes bacterium]|nr:MAG: hypothetical protein EP332_06960 [Bacteroidota bacterium]
MKYSILILFVFLYACASIDHPKGGPVDQTPPQVLSHSPDSNQLNFTGDKIVFHFDEYIEIKDPNAIIISPPVINKPDYVVKGKSLQIKFKDTLRSNTTYTIQLSNAIQDITEKNILPSQNLSFSTGSILDTLTIRGQVILNATDEVQKDITIALFHADVNQYPDSQIYPLLTTRSQADGSFLLQGIASGSYTLYAFEDINFNNRFETGEKFAYHDSVVVAGDSLEYTLRLANYELRSPYRIGSPKAIGTKHFKLPYTQHIPGNVSLKSSLPSFDKTQKVYTHKIHQDTLMVYDTYKSNQDTILTYFIYLDNVLKDSIKVDYTALNTPYHHYSLKGTKQQKLEPFDTLTIQFNEPLLAIDTSKIKLFKDSTERIKLNIANTGFASYLLFDRSYESNYLLILEPGAFKTVAYSLNSQDSLSFITPKADNYGSLQINWEGEQGLMYQIDLLKDKKEKPAFTLYSNTDSVLFSSIPAGTYYARISVVSERSTERLIPFKTQVEPYYYYPKPLELRGLWTIKDVLIHIH